jgi:hypothetical protein
MAICVSTLVELTGPDSNWLLQTSNQQEKVAKEAH